MQINPGCVMEKRAALPESRVFPLCAALFCWTLAFASFFVSASLAEEQHGKGSDQQGQGSYGAEGGSGNYGGGPAGSDGPKYQGLGGGGSSGFGYWGGRHVPAPPVNPDPPDNPDAPAPPSDADVGGGAGSYDYTPEDTPAPRPPLPTVAEVNGRAGNNDYTQLVEPGWCSGPGADAASIKERFSEKNMQRLMRSTQTLVPGIAPQVIATANSPLYKVAAYQLAMESSQPDLQRAGTLLGSIAQTELTPETIRQVHSYLCLIIPEALEAELRKIAASTRQKHPPQP